MLEGENQLHQVVFWPPHVLYIVASSWAFGIEAKMISNAMKSGDLKYKFEAKSNVILETLRKYTIKKKNSGEASGSGL